MTPALAFADFIDRRCARYTRDRQYRLKLERERPDFNPRSKHPAPRPRGA